MPQSNNLPAELTSFVGREREIAELATLLSTRARLVTLTGAGGSGKTRLALRVAQEILNKYPEGVWLVDLGPVVDAALVPQVVAGVLGLREGPSRGSLQALTTHFRSARVLIVFDSCEHLVDPCARLADPLLRSCPNLTILATSQEALGVAGELIWRVPSLSLPESDGNSDPVRLLRSEAIQLFAERARLVKPSFVVTAQNGPAIEQICRRLDGMPLAIELAAARIRLMGPDEILKRLEDRFSLLTGGSRTAVARQQTLRAAVEWSYEQLTGSEQALFRRLATFSGSFSLEAAEVVGASGTSEAAGVVDVLARLVDRSLVVAEDELTASPRYRLLESLRQYGQERLQVHGEAVHRRRHAEFFVAYAEKAEPYLTGPEQTKWLALLEEDHDNLRSAMRWALANEIELALRLGAALGRFWHMRGYLIEGQRSLAPALAKATVRSRALARAHSAAGLAAFWQGDYGEARSHGEASLNMARELGDQATIAFALNLIAVGPHSAGEFPAARAFYEESLAIRRELRDGWGISQCLNNLGLVSLEEGNYLTARALIAEALDVIDRVGDRRVRASALDSLARVAYEEGDYESATACYTECLSIAAELGDPMCTGYSLGGLAAIAAVGSRPEYALTLAAAAVALSSRVDFHDVSPVAKALADAVDRARAAIGPEMADAAWTLGKTMPIDDAIAMALRGPGAKPDGERGRGKLSAREEEIARLVATGLSNREIARRLTISERTADAHVEHIRNKLAVHSRAQIAAWAASEKLLPARS